MAQKKLPLEGVKVVEMGTVVAAPVSCVPTAQRSSKWRRWTAT